MAMLGQEGHRRRFGGVGIHPKRWHHLRTAFIAFLNLLGNLTLMGNLLTGKLRAGLPSEGNPPDLFSQKGSKNAFFKKRAFPQPYEHLLLHCIVFIINFINNILVFMALIFSEAALGMVECRSSRYMESIST